MFTTATLLEEWLGHMHRESAEVSTSGFVIFTSCGQKPLLGQTPPAKWVNTRTATLNPTLSF